jgi:hypothetical protein
VSGRRMDDTPLYVLTSARTFSGAEEFTNNMKVLKRAKIIGETTGGGANPGGFFPLPAGLGMFIPTGRAINPVTGKNWEGTGVEPDEKVSAEDAYNVAYREALAGIESSNNDPQAKADAAWARVALEARIHPLPTLSPEAMGHLAGNYGTRHITGEGGSMYLQLEDRPRRRLLQLTADTFAVEGVEAPRLVFGSAGLTEIYPDGRKEELARQ